jgi:hypothetical protein
MPLIGRAKISGTGPLCLPRPQEGQPVIEGERLAPQNGRYRIINVSARGGRSHPYLWSGPAYSSGYRRDVFFPDRILAVDCRPWVFLVGTLVAQQSKTSSDRQTSVLTGGDNYPIFTTLWSDKRRLVAWNRKYTPLFDIFYQVRRAAPDEASAQAKLAAILNPVQAGNISTLHSGAVDAGLTVTPGFYTIETSARNGIFYEALTIKENNGHLEEEWLVILDNKLEGDQRLLECSPMPHCKQSYDYMIGADLEWEKILPPYP